MAHIEYSTFENRTKNCDLTTHECTINIGDEIKATCYAYWNGSPIPDCWIILRFQDFYGTKYHDIWLGKTDSSGWFTANHQVTEDDIKDLGDTGGVLLHAHSDPKAWGDTCLVKYVQPTPTPACDVSTDKDEYYQGDTVTITYINAPAGSVLAIASPYGAPGNTWDVSGSGTKTYTIPDDAPSGEWGVYLQDTDCSKTKYITVLTVCNVSTDKDEYYLGDTVTINYTNAPPNSNLSIYPSRSGKGGNTWDVSGSGTKTYTIPDDASTGMWTVELRNTCYTYKYLTVLAPSSNNYDIILPVGYCLWGLDWIASNFVTKILPAITNALTRIGAGIVVHGDKSYYDTTNKKIVINADIPTESPIAPIIIYLIIAGVSVTLTLLGVWIRDTFFAKTGEMDRLSTFITPVDQYHEPINEKVTFTLSTGDVASTNPPEEYSAQFTLTKGTVFSITKIESEHYTGDPKGAWKDPHEAGDRVEVVLYPKDLVDVDVTVVDRDTHEPVEGVYVVLSDSYNRVIKYGTTDESGVAHISGVPKAKYTVGAYIAENTRIKAGEDFIDTRTQTVITLEIAVELRLSKLVYEKGTLVGIENVNVELIEASTNTVKDSGTTNEAGFVKLAIKPEDAGLYRLRLTKRNYNNNEPLLSDPFDFTESCSKVNYMELTERVSTVRILPLTEDNKTLPGAAHVTLEGFEEKTTGTDGSVTYKEVPYGEYKITIVARDYEQVEPDKRYVVDEKLENFQPRMRAVLPPTPITIECKVRDEKGEPIPDALIDIDSQKLVQRHEYPMSDAYVDVGSVSMVEFKGDGANVVTDDNGYCKFHLPAIGTEGIKGYYLRAGKPRYYNEKEEEDWTESTTMITESPAKPIEFTLSSPAPSILECLLPRIYTGKPFPRIAQQNPIPRVTCIVTAISKMWKRGKPWWW